MDEVTAVKELGMRIGRLETEQALMRGSWDRFATQVGDALMDMKANNKRIDDHETRLAVREAAWKEQILPALERLRNLELKVAASAFGGGALVIIGTELVKALSK